MNFVLRNIVAVMLVAICMACSADDPANKHCIASFDGMFSYSPASDNNDFYTAPVGEIALDFDDDNGVATVAIESINVFGVTLKNVLLSKLPFTTDAHSIRTISDIDLTGKGGIYPLQRIDLTYWPGEESFGKKYHAMYLQLTIADGRQLVVLPYESVGIGASETTTIATGQKYVSTKTIYKFSLDPDAQTATVTLDHTNFDANMPEFDNMVFEGNEPAIEMVFTGKGYKLACPSLIPKLSGTPFPRFVITALNCETNLAENETYVSFYCGGIYAVNASVSALYVEYNAE